MCVGKQLSTSILPNKIIPQTYHCHRQDCMCGLLTSRRNDNVNLHISATFVILSVIGIDVAVAVGAVGILNIIGKRLSTCAVKKLQERTEIVHAATQEYINISSVISTGLNDGAMSDSEITAIGDIYYWYHRTTPPVPLSAMV